MKRLLLYFTIVIGLTLGSKRAFAQAPNISYTPSTNVYTIGAAISTLTPANTGGAVPATTYGTVTTFAGSTAGTRGTTNGSGTAAKFRNPSGITINSSGTMFVADFGNNEIRQITSAAAVSLFAGSGARTTGTTNSPTGTSALFTGPNDITINPANGNMYVADQGNNEIRQVTSAAAVTLLAGSAGGATGTTNNTGNLARFNTPSGIIYDPSSGTIYVADFGNNEIRQVTTAGVVTLFAGSATRATGRTNATGNAALFNGPASIAVDGSGNVYVADQNNNEIRKITSAGAVSLFAGSTTGTAGTADGTGSAARFNAPAGITVDVSGNVYVSDSGNNTIRMITPAGVVTTIAGNVAGGYTDAVGTAAAFNTPDGLHIDPTTGNIFVTDNGNNVIREIIGTGYSISPALPAGLTFNSTTGNISGTPTAVSSATVYTITAFNVSGSFSTTVTISCVPLPPVISYTPSTIVYTVGTAITALTPANTGGTVVSYSISTALPAGLLFSTTTGVISGKPTAVSAMTTYTITATNTGGTGNTTVTITCNNPAPPSISYSPSTNVYTVGVAISMLTPANTGGTVVSYSISTALPAGLLFSTTTGVISGTPTAVSSTTTYTITATNAGGSGNTTVTITCNAPSPPVISYSPSTNAYLVGAAITPLTPTNTGGAIGAVGFGTGIAFTGVTLSGPDGIAIDASGNVYVADFTNGKIRKYTSSGTYNTTFGSGFTNPVGIVFDSSGNAYVLDRGAHDIFVFNSAGVLQATVTGFSSARGISIDASGNVYVSNTGATATVFKYTGGVAGGAATTFVNTVINKPYGTATDGAGNVYIVDNANNLVYKYNSAGTSHSTFVSGFNAPSAIAIDGAGNVYVADSGNGTVDVYNSGGTLLTSITGLNNPDGLTVDSQGNLYVSDSGANTVTKYPALGGYHISSALPAGLSFNNTTGSITGTPTASFSVTTYTVTAYSGGLSGSTTVTISCYQQFDWVGPTSRDWNTTTNWSTGTLPTSIDTARVGVAHPFTNAPVVSGSGPTTVKVKSIIFGNANGTTVGVTVNTGYTLNVGGDITKQSDAQSFRNNATYLAGGGTIKAVNLNILSNYITSPFSYVEVINASVTNLTLSGNISLTSNFATISSNPYTFNSTFNLTAGTTTVAGTLQTINNTGSTSTFAVTPTITATLKLANTTALSGLSATGTNTVTFNNPGATIEYSGAAQTVYTDTGIPGLASGVAYQNIAFSGTGIKTVPSGNLNIPGDFTNSLANDATDYVDLSAVPVNFNGTAQNLAGGPANGTVLYNVTVSGLGTKTMSGSFHVASSGILTMSGSSSSTILASNGALTLNSDATGSAIVPAFTGPQITGNVNAQRFLTGGNPAYRFYRLLTSIVNTGTGIYSLNYLKNSCYLTGTTDLAGGFDNPGFPANPTLFLFRENLAVSNASFTSGNYRGINDITAAPSYSLDGDGSGFTIPAGNGFLFFFRGDRSTSFASKTTYPYPVPENTTLTATGILNQGKITVKNWYTPSSSNLGFTNTPGNSTVQGFNLIGNPYPSPIDWDTYNTSSSTTGIYAPSVAPFTYILDPFSKNYSAYGAGFGGIGTLATTDANVIPSGQGFFVIATDSTAQLVFNESAKTNLQANATNGNLFLGTPVQAAVKQYLHLKLTQDSVNSVTADGIFISFNNSAKSQYIKGEDAVYKPGNGAVSLTSLSADSVDLAINTLALPTQIPTKIKLNVNAAADGVYQLNLKDIKSIPDLFDIWLMDAYQKDSSDIKHNPVYSFNVLKSDPASSGNKRFTIVIRQNPALGIHLLNFAASKAVGGAQVVWTTENEQNYTNFTVERSSDGGTTFNVLGGFPSSALGSYGFLDKAPPPTADKYRLRIEDLNGTISYSNVVTLMYGNINNTAVNNISVYPNPTAGIINLSIVQNAIATPAPGTPSYHIMITNSSGSIVKTAVSLQTEWQDNVSKLLPGSYVIQVVNTNDNRVIGKAKFVKL